MSTNKPGRPSLTLTRSLIALSAIGASAAQAGTIVGRVSDNTGSRALEGAEVTLSETGRRAVAGADGAFRFSDVAPGTYTLVASYVGTEPVESRVTVTGDESVRADVTLGSDADETIIVVGQRANMAGALSRQRASDTIDSVLTQDGVGQFPDQNVAEALRRASGINVLNDQGEGRFVAIRGLDPNLNSASINGARVPAPEADVRSVALDVLPTELVESIEIKKSLTPDMDGDSIGGSIEINTTSALDRREPFLSMSLENAYNDLSGENSPKGSVNFSRMLNDRFGIAGGVSYYDREFSTDNVEADGWDEADTGGAFADTIEYRDYDVVRTRFGTSLSLDFRASEDTLLYARMLHSRFEDQEFRNRLIFEMDEQPTATGVNTAQFLSDDGEIAVIRDIKDRYEEQTIQSIVLGGETFAGPWSIRYELADARAEEKENGSLDPTAFERGFEEPGELDLTFDYSDPSRPTFAVTPTTMALFDDASEYEFDVIERTTLSLSEDDETTFRFDTGREFALDRGDFEIQFGAKLRQREKVYDAEIDFLEGPEITLADVLGGQSYGLADLGPLPDPSAVRSFYSSSFADFERDDVDSDFDSAVSDYRVDEDVTAAYVMGRYDNGRLRIAGGFRFEQTENEIFGNQVELVEEGAIRNGVPLADDTVFVTPVRFSRDYDHTLPSVNLRYELREDLLFRAAYYQSLMRPNIGNLAPRFEVEEAGDGEREGVFGNPDLEPYEAENIDLSLEWYFADNAVLQGGVFVKDIDNFIAVTVFEDFTFNGVFVDEGEIPVNGESADVRGFELGYQHALTSLPAPFNGLLFGFNYTYTDTEALIDGRTIPLPAAAESTWNGTIGYDNGRFNIRFAMTYRDEYLDELGGDALEDRWVRDHLQYDLTAKLQLNDRFQLFAEFVNLGDEPYLAFQRGPGADRLLQYEEYSWTGKLGFRAVF